MNTKRASTARLARADARAPDGDARGSTSMPEMSADARARERARGEDESDSARENRAPETTSTKRDDGRAKEVADVAPDVVEARGGADALRATTERGAAAALGSTVTDGGAIEDGGASGGRNAVAFFDLDHTIVDVNSSWLWVKSEINSGRVGVGHVGTALYWFSRYALGYGDGAETAGRDAALLYKGETEDSFRERIENFFRMDLANRTRPGFKTVLDEHKARGVRCVMCTSTWQHPAEIGAEIYGLETGRENIVSSHMGVDADGRMDGTIQVVAYGDGKYETTKKWCDKNGINLRDCYFYTDSMSDVKLLENVGHPVCVNPDSRLKKYAKEKGWPTVDWGKSEEKKKKPRYTYGCLTCSA